MTARSVSGQRYYSWMVRTIHEPGSPCSVGYGATPATEGMGRVCGALRQQDLRVVPQVEPAATVRGLGYHFNAAAIFRHT
jgi:hypothetical protein